MREVTFAPGATGLGNLLLARSCKSALGSSISNETVSVVFDGFGSGKPAGGATVAELLIVPPVAALAVTGIWKVAWPVREIAPAVQVTVWPLAEQPAGKVPMVKRLSIVSTIVAPAGTA